MARYTPRRRVTLTVDCLEDRYAPAVLDVLGQTVNVVPLVAQVNLDAAAAGRFAVTATAAPSAAPETIPFGFFHPFCQNGFGGGEEIIAEMPAPLPRPVMPPLGPAQLLPEIDLFEPPPAPRADAEPAAPMPTEDPPAAVVRIPAVEKFAAPLEQSRAERVSESAPAVERAETFDPVTPASNGSRKGFALGAFLAAASLLSLRNVRERHYDDTGIYRL
jgi:hypothetical protein